MIISVSRRTDIPAFYSQWFSNRIEEGYFYRINPYNSKQVKKISLLPENVDVFVFWTKDPKNFMQYLGKLDEKGYHYYFQYTLNDYPQILERNVRSTEERIDTLIALSKKIGKEKVIWRYDPIVVTDQISLEEHIKKFKDIAHRLNGYTDRVVISFLDFYGKINNRLKKLQEMNHFKIYDMTQYVYRDRLRDFASTLQSISAKNGLDIFTCSEKIDLTDIGIEQGKCIDAELINKIFQLNINVKKDKNQREECLCTEAIDMGMYNSCNHGCIYCYANYSDKVIHQSIKQHYVNSPILIGKYDGSAEEDEKIRYGTQMKFDEFL